MCVRKNRYQQTLRRASDKGDPALEPGHACVPHDGWSKPHLGAIVVCMYGLNMQAPPPPEMEGRKDEGGGRKHERRWDNATSEVGSFRQQRTRDKRIRRASAGSNSRCPAAPAH